MGLCCVKKLTTCSAILQARGQKLYRPNPLNTEPVENRTENLSIIFIINYLFMKYLLECVLMTKVKEQSQCILWINITQILMGVGLGSGSSLSLCCLITVRKSPWHG